MKLCKIEVVLNILFSSSLTIKHSFNIYVGVRSLVCAYVILDLHFLDQKKFDILKLLLVHIQLCCDVFSYHTLFVFSIACLFYCVFHFSVLCKY